MGINLPTVSTFSPLLVAAQIDRKVFELAVNNLC